MWVPGCGTHGLLTPCDIRIIESAAPSEGRDGGHSGIVVKNQQLNPQSRS